MEECPMEKRKFTNEFKQEAVKLVLVMGLSVSVAAQDLGLNSTTLHGWLKKAREGVLKAHPCRSPSSIVDRWASWNTILRLVLRVPLSGIPLKRWDCILHVRSLIVWCSLELLLGRISFRWLSLPQCRLRCFGHYAKLVGNRI